MTTNTKNALEKLIARGEVDFYDIYDNNYNHRFDITERFGVSYSTMRKYLNMEHVITEKTVELSAEELVDLLNNGYDNFYDRYSTKDGRVYGTCVDKNFFKIHGFKEA